MVEFNHIEILEKIASAVQVEDISHITPLPVDRWIASSILQKCVRRGLVETAQRAAMTYWLHDRRSFWQRLPIICLEDCGVASPHLLVKVLTACNHTAWRVKHDELRVALYLVRLMCGATKIRLSDEIYPIAAHASEYRHDRVTLATVDNNTLADIVLNNKMSLAKRCMALWFLVGTKRYPADTMPMRLGCLDTTIDIMRALHAPDDLTEVCIGSLKKSPYPLALFTPLLWRELQYQADTQQIISEQFPVSATVQDVPLVALDGFTRLGKASFATLQKQVPALKCYSLKHISLGVFYTEGFCLNHRLTSPRLEEYREAGELADAEGVGLCIPSYLALREILHSEAPRLNDIRAKQLRQYLKSANLNAIVGKPTFTPSAIKNGGAA